MNARTLGFLMAVTLLSLVCTSAIALPPDLVGYWNFNDCGGTVVSDITGNGNDAIIVAPAAWGNDPFLMGCYVEFGDEGHLRINPSSVLDFDGNSVFTVEAFVSIDDPSACTYIVSDNPVTGGWDPGYALMVWDSLPVLRLEDGNHEELHYGTTPIVAGRRYHMAMTVDLEANLGALYVDGELDSLFDISGIGNIANSTPLGIGARIGKAYQCDLFGKIDELRVWNTVRTGKQIRQWGELSLDGTVANAPVPTVNTTLGKLKTMYR